MKQVEFGALPAYRVVSMCVLRTIASLAWLGLLPLTAATLEQISLGEMIEQSTAIVRARTAESRGVREGRLIYTLTRLEVIEQWKGEPLNEVEVALPGGSVGGLSQRFGGVPRLEPGSEFVFFLWKGPSGRIQITGLSQGLFAVTRAEEGDLRAARGPSGDLMLAPKTGVAVQDRAIEMPLRDLVATIRSVLSDAK